MLTVVFFLWYDKRGKRNNIVRYGAEHVNLLRRQVDRHMRTPHEFVLICDDVPKDLDPGIRTVPLDPTTHVAGTMFAKLMLFKPDIGETVGKRMFYLDLDTVITGALDSLVDRPEQLVLWRHPKWGYPKRSRYNSSVILMNAGCRPDIWFNFDPWTTPAAVRSEFNGHDQAWISECVGPDMPYWDASDGIYTAKMLSQGLPPNARLVTFPGKQDPSQRIIRKLYPWIDEHRR